MKKKLLTGAIGACVMALGITASGTAHAAGSWGGSASPLPTISYLNSWYSTGSVNPTGSPSGNIQNIQYTLIWNSSGYNPGSFNALICAGSTCTTAYSGYGNSTTGLNGVSANTPVYFKVQWANWTTGALKNPVKVTTATVNVTY